MIAKSFVVIAFGAFTSLVNAQEHLTIQETIKQAVIAHPNFRGAQAELSAAGLNSQAARNQRFPSVTLGVGQTLVEGGNERPSTTLRLDQPIYSFGRISAQVTRAEADAEVKLANLQATAYQIAIATATTFIDVLRLLERERLSERNLSRHQALYESIARRAEAQVSPESDLLLTASRLAQAETELDQLRSARTRATRTLAELLQKDSINPLSLKPPHAPPLPDKLDDVLSAAERVSPEIDKQEAGVRVAQAELDLTKAQALPTLYARYERKFGPLDLFAAREQTSLAIDFNPGAGLSALYSSRAAAQRLASAEVAIVSTKRAIRDRLIPIWVNRSGLISQLPIAVRYAEASQGVAESFERQFAIGRKSWLDVLNAQREAAQSEQSVAELRWSTLSLSYQILLEIDPSSYSAPVEDSR